MDQDKVTLASKKDSKDNVVAKGLSAWSKKDVAKLNKNDIKAYYSYLNGVLEKAGENKTSLPEIKLPKLKKIKS